MSKYSKAIQTAKLLGKASFLIKKKPYTLNQVISVDVPSFSFTPEDKKEFENLCGSGNTASRIVFPHTMAQDSLIQIISDPCFPANAIGSVHLKSYFDIIHPNLLDTWLSSPGSKDYDLKVSFQGIAPGSKRGSELSITIDILQHGKILVWRETMVVFISNNPIPKLVNPQVKLNLEELQTKFQFENLENTNQVGSISIRDIETWRFALLSGDINPIHVNQIVARILGQKSRIAHGAMVLGKSLTCIDEMMNHKRSTLPYSIGVSFKGPTPSHSTAYVKLETNSFLSKEMGNYDVYNINNDRPCLCIRHHLF